MSTKIIFDYSRLKGKIKEIFDTEGAFGDAMGWSVVTTSYKLNGKSDFTHSEIYRAAELLAIAPDTIGHYFFTTRV